MGNKRVLGLAGLIVAGVALSGCQSSRPANTMAYGTSGGPTARTATAQATQGADTKPSSPADPSNAGGTGGAGMASRGATPGAATNTIDPSALPRTSQDMLPRTVGNQLSSYTTVPSMATGPAAGSDPSPAPIAHNQPFSFGSGGGPAAGGVTLPVNGPSRPALPGPGPTAGPVSVPAPGVPVPASLDPFPQPAGADPQIQVPAPPSQR